MFTIDVLPCSYWGGNGRGREDRTGGHHPGGDTRIKLIFLAQFRTLDKRCRKVGVVTIRQAKRSSVCRGRWLKEKKVVSFSRQNRWRTPSVAAPGDTNFSDATAVRLHLHTTQWTIKTWHVFMVHCVMQRMVLVATIKPSLLPSNAWQNERNFCPHFIPYQNVYHSFPTRRMVGEGPDNPL